MSRTDNTAPYRLRDGPADGHKLWNTRAMSKRKRVEATAWWHSVRAREREALAEHTEPPPAKHRHRAVWDCW